jgi:hypothetical protein
MDNIDHPGAQDCNELANANGRVSTVFRKERQDAANNNRGSHSEHISRSSLRSLWRSPHRGPLLKHGLIKSQSLPQPNIPRALSLCTFKVDVSYLEGMVETPSHHLNLILGTYVHCHVRGLLHRTAIGPSRTFHSGYDTHLPQATQ